MRERDNDDDATGSPRSLPETIRTSGRRKSIRSLARALQAAFMVATPMERPGSTRGAQSSSARAISRRSVMLDRGFA